jgi:hypothetical protein
VELKIATIDSFQGQERDLILFSPCVGPHSPTSGLTFFARDTRRLNVAISRARAVAMTFGDLGFARSGRSTALQRLAAKSTEPRQRSGEPAVGGTGKALRRNSRRGPLASIAYRATAKSPGTSPPNGWRSWTN